MKLHIIYIPCNRNSNEVKQALLYNFRRGISFRIESKIRCPLQGKAKLPSLLDICPKTYAAIITTLDSLRFPY